MKIQRRWLDTIKGSQFQSRDSVWRAMGQGCPNPLRQVRFLLPAPFNAALAQWRSECLPSTRAWDQYPQAAPEHQSVSRSFASTKGGSKSRPNPKGTSGVCDLATVAQPRYTGWGSASQSHISQGAASCGKTSSVGIATTATTNIQVASMPS